MSAPRRRRFLPLAVTLGAACALALAGPPVALAAPPGGSSPNPPGVEDTFETEPVTTNRSSIVRSDPSPVIGTWDYGGGAITVSRTGETAYVGVVARETTFNTCPHPVGQRIWTMTWNGSSFTGTHLGWTGECVWNAPMASTWRLGSDSAGSLTLTLCNSDGCSVLRRSAPTDTTPPKVVTYPTSGVIRTGQRIPVRWAVTDDSGKARWHAELYSGGTLVASGASTGQDAATGGTRSGSFAAGSGTGPYFFCFWAEDAAGNRSADAPRSSCQWLSVQVPVTRVSNGCGGAQWGPFWASVQNWFLDTGKFGGYKVNFRMACHLHDAGYAGATVADPFTGRIVDFRTWSRLRVDNKFYDDIGTLCGRYLYNAQARKYLWRCSRGMPMDTAAGLTSPGALAYYQGVRAYAEEAYDADATTPGTQTVMPSTTVPTGGARSNG